MSEWEIGKYAKGVAADPSDVERAKERLEAERWDGISAQALVGDVESQRGKA